MTEQTKHQNIHEAIAAISREATAIGKDSKNTQQGFSFRGIDAVMNAMHPLFAKHGVFIAPECLDDKVEERQTQRGGNLIYRILKIRYHFIHESGSEIASTFIGEGMDSGDKASNKAAAVSLKYALTQLLLLPYDEVDPDATTPEPSKRKPIAKQAPKPAAKPPAHEPDELEAAGLGNGDGMPPAPKASSKDIKSWYNDALKKYGTNELVQEALFAVTGKAHSKDLTIEDIMDLNKALAVE